VREHVNEASSESCEERDWEWDVLDLLTGTTDLFCRELRKNMKRVMSGIVVTCCLFGCATKPENIKPQYVSEVPYQTWTCEQLVQEKVRLDSAINTVSDQQRTTREHDVGWILLFGLPLSSMSGKGHEYEIGQLKGESEAIQNAGSPKKCVFPAAPEPTPEPKPSPSPLKV
jgi:hypothetical protein